jgi:hypothetical protein
LEELVTEGNTWVAIAKAYSPSNLLVTDAGKIAMKFVEYVLVDKAVLQSPPVKTKEEKMLKESERILKAGQELLSVTVGYLPPGGDNKICGTAVKLEVIASGIIFHTLFFILTPL